MGHIIQLLNEQQIGNRNKLANSIGEKQQLTSGVEEFGINDPETLKSYGKLCQVLFDGAYIERVHAAGLYGAPVKTLTGQPYWDQPSGFGRELNELLPTDSALVMLVDEEGLLKGLPPNPLASLLYGTPLNGHVIRGSAYLVIEQQLFDDPLEPVTEWICVPDSVTHDVIERYLAELVLAYQAVGAMSVQVN